MTSSITNSFSKISLETSKADDSQKDLHGFDVPVSSHSIEFYAEVSGGKIQEINNIRQALHLSQDKILWEVLDEGRKSSHSKVRQNTFLQKLVVGGFCQTQFMRYLVNLLPVHLALEEAQKELLQINHLKIFVHKELFRSEAITQDLKIWEFVAAKEFVPWKPSNISLDYAKYIREISKEDPERIIGIMYALYGTLMSGGQTNKLVVQKALATIRNYTDDIPDGSGVALYEIKEEKILDDKEIAKFKIKWHENLCRIETKMPPSPNIEHFHDKLNKEVAKTFATILEIIEKNVESGHC